MGRGGAARPRAGSGRRGSSMARPRRSGRGSVLAATGTMAASPTGRARADLGSALDIMMPNGVNLKWEAAGQNGAEFHLEVKEDGCMNASESKLLDNQAVIKNKIFLLFRGSTNMFKFRF